MAKHLTSTKWRHWTSYNQPVRAVTFNDVWQGRPRVHARWRHTGRDR